MENFRDDRSGGAWEADQTSSGVDRDLIWWYELADRLPLGMFILSGPGRDVKVNAPLARLLRLETKDPLSEKAFWNRLRGLTVDVDQPRLKFRQIHRELSHNDQASVMVKIAGVSYLVELAVLSPQKRSGLRYLGWFQEADPEPKSTLAQISLLSEICSRSRMAAAGAYGNLSALFQNLAAWSADVQADFIDQAVNQVSAIQEFLDLALSFAGLIQNEPAYREPVEIGSLLKKLIQEDGVPRVQMMGELLHGDQGAQALIDPGLTALALRTLLSEVIATHPAGQHLEATLERRDDFLVLRFASPQTLPLPGLDLEEQAGIREELPLKLALIRELLRSQGGELEIIDQPEQEGGGVDIKITLPVSELPRSHPILAEEDHPGGRILLADAQPDYQVLLRDELSSRGYRVDLAVDGTTAMDLVQTIKPDLVIVDRNLPGMDGLLVTQSIRRWSTIPLIMISSRSDSEDQLYAYQLGVDDYLRKPFLVGELLAKVRVFISREHQQQQAGFPQVYHSGSVRIDHSLRQVWVRGKLVDLTPIEYNLLVTLSRQGKQIVPYQLLLENVWEGPEKGTRQGLFVHVSRLREKIELDPDHPQIVRNKWGVGYLFNP